VVGVDYGSRDVAHRYAGGRALNDDVLEGWHAAVSQFAPPERSGQRVLDVGAGSGIFARAWPRWRQCEVVALEPAAAMRLEIVAGGLPEHVHIVAGRGERLPLQRASIHIAWLSTVVHHLASLDECASELRRVLTDDGVVLIRGLFADSGAPPGLRFLPRWERALSAFPSTVKVEAIFSAYGFGLVGRTEVADSGPLTIGEAAGWIRHLRHADSFLARFTDDEIAAGLAAMDARDTDEPLDPGTLTLLAFSVR
jgi:ubiquinone/menaquinone biosynthesis C-methylase UbiE